MTNHNSYYAKTGSGIHQFSFRVKFYSSDPCALREEITRYQFFLQLKSDVRGGGLLPVDDLARLAALVLQAECGDFSAEEHDTDFVSEFRFAPSQTEDLEAEVLAHYANLRYGFRGPFVNNAIFYFLFCFQRIDAGRGRVRVPEGLPQPGALRRRHAHRTGQCQLRSSSHSLLYSAVLAESAAIADTLAPSSQCRILGK